MQNPEVQQGLPQTYKMENFGTIFNGMKSRYIKSR